MAYLKSNGGRSFAIKTFEQENLHCKYHKIRNTYGIKISGIPLDDETQDIITFEM